MHHGPDRAGRFGVGGEAGSYDDGLRAKFQGLEHRHRGADSVDAGQVAAGRDDASMATAYYDGVIAEAGIVTLFDAGVESIAVHVRDGEGVKLRMDNNPGAAAGGAARAGLKLGQTIATQGGLDGRV